MLYRIMTVCDTNGDQMKPLTVLRQRSDILAIQKCYLPNVYADKLSSCQIGCYVFVHVSETAKCLCKLYWKNDLHNSFCYIDSSVVTHCGQKRTIGRFFEETVNWTCKDITLENIQIVSLCAAITYVNVSVVFETVADRKKWQKNFGSPLDIVKDCLKLYIIAKDSVVHLKNLKKCQTFGIYCFFIHEIGSSVDGSDLGLIVGRVVYSTTVRIVNSLSRAWLDYSQKSSRALPISGLDGPYQFLQEIILHHKLYHQFAEKLKIQPCRQVLVVGPPGCGKTSLVRRVTADCGGILVSVLGPEAFQPRPGDTENWLRNVFEEAFDLAEESLNNDGVCVLLLDEVDSLCAKRSSGKSAAQVRTSTQLLTLLEQACHIRGLVIIATTNRLSALDPAIRRPGRLETEVHIGIPTDNEREQILQTLTSSLPFDEKEREQLCKMVAHLAPGYVGADLSLLCQDVILKRHKEKAKNSTCSVEDWLKDFRSSVAKIRPSSLRGGLGVVTTSLTKFSDIGGMNSIKQSLRAAVEWPLLYPEAFKKFGLPHPKGVLLYGPPGCAKTSIARALACAMNVTFLSISAAELYSPYVGDAEKNIGELFHRARLGAPTILFIDEIDGLVGSRGHRERGVQERVLSALLTEMDGIGVQLDSLPTMYKQNATQLQINVAVVVIAATNRPDLLDDALLRPGRFDKLLYVPPPDSETRFDILKVLAANIPLGDCVDLQALSQATELFSGADLNNLCREATLCALTEEGMMVNQVKYKHFLQVLKHVQPSLSKHQIEWYRNYKK